jgi:O-antigen/teichoic acid export membrane protein
MGAEHYATMLSGHTPTSTGADPPPDAAEELGRTTGASVISGGLWSAVSRVVPQVQLLALSIIAARYLGLDGMGRQSFIAFVGITVTTVAVAGLPGSLSRFVGELLGARANGVALSLYTWTWRVEAVAALLACGGVAAVAVFGGDPAGAWILAGVTAALAVLQSVPQSLLVGAQRWREATAVGVLTGVAAVPAAIAVLSAGGGITGLFAVEAAVVAVNLAWMSRLARRLAVALEPAAPVPDDTRRQFLSFAGVSTALAVIQYFVWRRSELIVLDAVAPDAEIALYSIAFAIAFGLTRIPESVAKVAMPAVATLSGAGDDDRIRSGFWRATRLLAFMTPPVVAGAAVTGPAVLRLAYGDAFAGAGDVLLVLLAPLLVMPILLTAEALLFGLARLRFLFTVTLIASVVDVTLSLLVIPPLQALGAGIANASAQLVAGVPCFVLAARLTRPVDIAWGPLTRGVALAALVGAVAATVLAVLGDGALGLVAAISAGVLCFAALAPFARPLPAGDAQWLADALGEGTGARAALARAVRRLEARS